MLRTPLVFFLFLFTGVASAAPLGTVPRLEDSNLRIILDMRSDAWTSPYAAKSGPVRILSGQARVPIFSGSNWKSSLSVYSERLSLSRADISLGDKNVFIQNDLRSESVGFGVKGDFENGATASAFLAFSSASDAPFESSRNSFIEGTVSFLSANNGGRRYIFMVDQSNNRGFLNNIPFPYFGVVYEPDVFFRASFGFLFLHFTLRGEEGWIKDFMLTPFGVNLSFSRALPGEFIMGFATGVNIRSYLHESRALDAQRLFYQEALAEVSLVKILSIATGVTFSAGYSFERRMYESEKIYSPNSAMTVVPNDLYAKAKVEFNLW